MQFQPHERSCTVFLHPATLVKWACTIRNWYYFAVSGNPKTKLPSHSNSVFFSTNNEKRKTYAQRNLLKRKRPKPEHKAPKRHVEVGMSDLHRIQATYIPVNRGSLHFPAAADPPGWMRWSPEDGEGGLRRVLLPRPLVRRKATIKSTRAMRYSSLKKPKQTTKAKRRFLINAPQGNNKIYKSDAVFRMEEARINDTRTT